MFFIYKIRRLIRRTPCLYFLLAGSRASVRRLRAYRDSALVVEAFPRSGNTTSVYALFYAQGTDLTVGHHLHVPAHVKYAVRHQIPCLVIMRDPLDCVSSLLVMRDGGNVSELLRDYIDFAQTVINFNDGILVISFDHIVNNGMAAVVSKLNEQFGTKFNQPDGSPEEHIWVTEQIKEWNRRYSGGDEQRLSFPTEVKKERSIKMKELVKKEKELLKEATKFYQHTIQSCALL